MSGPLTGIRVLDMTSVLMGPYATSILGDMGADVIKLESPEGDLIRQVGPSRSGAMGGMFMHANRSKRSIVVDLKKPAGRDVALNLARTVDVLVYNLRPQAMDRLGLGYESLAGAKQDIIYVGTFGFGQDGPYAAKPAYDDLVQGLCAVPALIADAGDGTPRYVPINIADRIVGLHALTAILAALRHRDRTGEGQRIDVPMFETMASFVLGDHFGGLSYEPPLDGGGYARLLASDRRPFRTADGYLCAVIYTDRHWQRFIDIAGQDDWRGDPRFASHSSRTRHMAEIMKSVAGIFLTRSTAEWERSLGAADIPHARMHTLDSLVNDPHLTEVGFFPTSEHPSEGPVRSLRVASQWGASQPRPDRAAPRLGEHSREVLAEVGYAEAEVQRLIAAGVVACPNAEG
ncbi:MAG TPA: CoA transferase [Bosea sp. (in: a-proteobacteria)]|jgi:crotonobetainyl-CoA:carnitine CoA-transferase CaiB-like acyl-CoA transferase|uniref:CaiB/BaiF CoA transferase family protein n=1 Tax=Bosea sp. (in: a-proteobacteria) TaxID=1871050 RepID=UPI002E16786D|nr:CoA transferase [Bosea sp. (in: a-proteobacteria)]